MSESFAPTGRATRSRGFFWQGVFILLPMVVLALIGFVSIRQDKALAEREAAERAQTLAEEAADSIWAALTSLPRTGGELTFVVDARGALLSPQPVSAVPAPSPFATGELTPYQLQLWGDMQNLASPADAIRAGRELLATHPPERFEVAIRFKLAGLQAARGEVEQARQWYEALRQPALAEVLGETGLPIAPLAQLKWIELTSPTNAAYAVAVEALCSNALAHPSALSPFLLDQAVALRVNRAEVQRWKTLWERSEQVRSLHAAAFASILHASGSNQVRTPPQRLPRFLWFHTADSEEALWRATRIETNALGIIYDCRLTPQDQLVPDFELEGPGTPRVVWATRFRVVGNPPKPVPVNPNSSTNAPPDPFAVAVMAVQSRLPMYLGLTLDVAGRTVISSNQLRGLVLQGGAKGAGRHWVATVDLSAIPSPVGQARRFDEGVEALRVGIHLTSPEMLYDRQHSRATIFSLLILVATITSVIGFVSARRAYRRQQQLGELKSNFVSSVSHELRAPLASVRLMAESLEQGRVTEPARQRDYYRFIVQECRRLGTLIENVLDFARIEQGRKEYEFEPTDVAALVQRTVQLLEPVAAERNVRLQLERPPHGTDAPPPDAPGAPGPSGLQPTDSDTSLVDGPAIQQALINLIDNAIKHSPAGATVTVSLASISQPPTLQLSVADAGPGIPVEEHGRIFERFYRRGPELRRETQGVGIGLSIVKHIVEAHHGRVRVVSGAGQGSRFVLELPLTENTKHQAPNSK